MNLISSLIGFVVSTARRPEILSIRILLLAGIESHLSCSVKASLEAESLKDPVQSRYTWNNKPEYVQLQAPLNLRTLWRYINQFLTFNI